MEIKLMILDNDLAYLLDVKEYLDSVGRFKTDVATLENISKRSYRDYDLVIANEKISSLIDNPNTISMFPEFSVGKGFAKFSGKQGLIECINENNYVINGIKGKPYIISFFVSGNTDKALGCFKKIQKEIEEQDRKILFINLSYSMKTISRSGISSSDLIFYLSSGIEEKEAFIKNILRSEKNYLYLDSVNSLQEIFEIEDEILHNIFLGIKEIGNFEYICVVIEPGLRKSIYTYGEHSDLNVLLVDKDISIIEEIIRYSSEHSRILPILLGNTKTKAETKDKRLFEPFIFQSGNRFLRRIDGIFT